MDLAPLDSNLLIRPMDRRARRPGAGATALVCALLLSGCAEMARRPEVPPTAPPVVIPSAPGASLPASVWSTRMDERLRMLHALMKDTPLEVERTPDGRLRMHIPAETTFDTNSARLKPQVLPHLETLAQFLEQEPQVHLAVIGHTDNTGSPAVNEPLSLARARSLRDFLVARKVQPQGWIVTGHAARDPVADNSTEAGRARNRRVELYISEIEVGTPLRNSP